MAKKKKKHKFKHRNAAPATPRAPRAPRVPRAVVEEETAGRRLAMTAAGAASTALVGSFLAKQGWAPKTIAAALTAVGTGLAWKGDGATIRSIGAGTMSAAGGQLALQIIDDREDEKKVKPSDTATATTAKKPANADGVPAGALEAAFERARSRLALASDEVPTEYIA